MESDPARPGRPRRVVLLIIESESTLRRKLCNLLNKERIVGTESVMTAVEKICYFRAEVNLIVARLDHLFELFNRQIIRKVCDKLYIAEPPVVGYYTRDEENSKDDLLAMGATYDLLLYEDSDPAFPDRLAAALAGAYPALNFDREHARQEWSKTPEQEKAEFIDPQKWLHEQGFAEIVNKRDPADEKNGGSLEKTIIAIESMLAAVPESGEESIDYKKLYLETRKKLDVLARYITDLMGKLK